MNSSREAAPIFDWPPEGEDQAAATSANLEDLLSRQCVETLKIRVRLCEDGDLQPIADAIARAPRPALRRLVLAEYGEPLGDWFGDGEPYGHWGNLGDLSRVWSSVPALNEIVLQGHSMTLGQIELPTVTSVAIRGTLSAVNLRAIASAKWAQVERLEIFFGDPADGADGADGCVDDIAAVLSGAQLPQLRELGLTYCGFVDQIIERLDQIGVLPRLTALERKPQPLLW